MLYAYGYQHIKSAPYSIDFSGAFRSFFKSPFFSIAYDELLQFFDHLLRQCNGIHRCKQIHSAIIATGACSSPFVAAQLVSVYARLGLVSDARKVFDVAPSEGSSNLLLWNSIVRANVSHARYGEALELYAKMRRFGVMADGFTFPLVLRACSYEGSLNFCKSVHGHVEQVGLQNHVHVANELIGMYARIRRMDDAYKVFDKMPLRSIVSWNAMVSGYAYNYDVDGASRVFVRMEMEGVEPNPVTWTSLMSSHVRCGRLEETMDLFSKMRKKGVGATAEMLAVVLSVCADLAAFNGGKMIHGCLIRGGFEDYLFAKNALITVYGKNKAIREVEKLFDELKVKNLVSWNALISSYAESGLCDEAFQVFSQLEKSEARPNVVTWSAIICGFASEGREEGSLELFRRMQLANVKANSVTVSSVLSVCSSVAALNLGKEIHGHVIRALMDTNILVGNGLINMYAKCGSFKPGCLVFEKLEEKDLVSCNSMITGYGMHGHGKQALRIFDQMIKNKVNPDEVTFIAALSACSHAGLVAEGRELFCQMLTNFGIEPRMEHYACMVDLLGRSGHLDEASELVSGMPIEPNACIWSALLNSCRMHKDTDFAERMASRILCLNSESEDSGIAGSHMLLSNVFAASCRWEDSAKVRISARTKGLKKVAGQSWIEVKKKVYLFKAGNLIPAGLEEVYEILYDLALHIQSNGYVDDVIE